MNVPDYIWWILGGIGAFTLFSCVLGLVIFAFVGKKIWKDFE